MAIPASSAPSEIVQLSIAINGYKSLNLAVNGKAFNKILFANINNFIILTEYI